MTFKEGALLDGQAFVENVTHDMRGLGQRNRPRPYLARHKAMNPDLIANDLAIDLGCFANNQDGGVYVAVDSAIDLDFAIAAQIADDFEVGA